MTSCTYYWSEKPAFFFNSHQKLSSYYIGTGIKKFVCLHLKWSTRTQKASWKYEKLKKTENFIKQFRLKKPETFQLQEVLLRKRYCAVKYVCIWKGFTFMKHYVWINILWYRSIDRAQKVTQLRILVGLLMHGRSIVPW